VRLAVADLERPLELALHARRQLDRHPLVCLVGAHDDELVPAETRHEILVADDGPDSLRRLDEEAVAGLVTEAVVDDLEAVEVDEQQAHRAPSRRCPCDRDGKLVEEAGTVRKAGQRVLARLAVQRRLERLVVRDVAKDPGEREAVADAHLADRELHREHLAGASEPLDLDRPPHDHGLTGREVPLEACLVAMAVRLGNEDAQRLPHDLGGLPAEDLRRGSVEREDRPVRVDRDHALRRALDDRRAELLALGEVVVEQLHLAGGDLDRPLERVAIVVRVGVGRADPPEEMQPPVHVRRHGRVDPEPAELAGERRMDRGVPAHAAIRSSEKLVRVIVWLCRSQVPAVIGEISPYE